MATFWQQYRTIILDDCAQLFVDEHFETSNAQWRGIEWLLARRPESGVPKSKNSPNEHLIYVVPCNETAKTKEVWLLYSFDESSVTVHGVNFGNS